MCQAAPAKPATSLGRLEEVDQPLPLPFPSPVLGSLATIGLGNFVMPTGAGLEPAEDGACCLLVSGFLAVLT